MAVVLLENGMVSDQFELGKAPYVYKDAIVMPEDQYNALSASEIEAMKQARFDNWYKIITTPVENPNPEAPAEA